MCERMGSASIRSNVSASPRNSIQDARWEQTREFAMRATYQFAMKLGKPKLFCPLHAIVAKRGASP